MNLRVLLPAGFWPRLARWSSATFGGLAVAGSLLLIAALRLEWVTVFSAESGREQSIAPQERVAPSTQLRLPPDKLAAAELHLATAELCDIQSSRSVPGSITYDAARRVPVNAPVAAVVILVLVEPGQQVHAGDRLAILSSAEVGLARDEVLKRDTDLVLARREETRAAQVASNVDELLALLAKKPKLQEIEAKLEGKALGDYREKIVGAYSKLVLAELVVEESVALEGGTLSRRIVEQRQSAREVAAAQYSAACDTARFSAVQDRDKANAITEQTQRLLAVAQQALANLLGPLAEMTPVTDRSDPAKMSELVLKAPIAGRIEERHAVQAARVTAGGPLFTVADTETIWVSAEIHERDWAALNAVKMQGQIVVRIPALSNAELTARLHHIGAQVAADTRSVPLVAELLNGDGRLKPGMFVWVDVPLELPRPAIVVPAGAIMRHENQPFVFVPVSGNEFRRVDVETGLETRSGIEIVSGLTPGTQVVDRGAFYLKSELLLEREG